MDKSEIEKALEEARRGEIVGPFESVDELMKDLLDYSNESDPSDQSDWSDTSDLPNI